MNNNIKKLISIIAAILAVILVFSLISGRGVEKTTKQALKALHENKPSKFISLMHDEAVEYQMEDRNLATKKLLKKEYENIFDNFQTQMKEKYGKNWKYDIEIIDSYDYEPSDSVDLSTLEGKKIKEVAYEITYSGKSLFKDEEGTERGTFLLVKEGNKWYIINFD